MKIELLEDDEPVIHELSTYISHFEYYYIQNKLKSFTPEEILEEMLKDLDTSILVNNLQRINTKYFSYASKLSLYIYILLKIEDVDTYNIYLDKLINLHNKNFKFDYNFIPPKQVKEIKRKKSFSLYEETNLFGEGKVRDVKEKKPREKKTKEKTKRNKKTESNIIGLDLTKFKIKI